MKRGNQSTIVKEWLKECDENGVKPWEYDFKLDSVVPKRQHIAHRFLEETNPIKRILDWYVTGDETIETETTPIAKAIYSILWGIDRVALDNKLLDMDVMNSFWTMYKLNIELHYNDIYAKHIKNGVNAVEINKLKEKFYEYETVNTLFESFAAKTHTIGNFIVEHKGFNRGRYNNDFWDLALFFIKTYSELQDETAWKKKVGKFFLEPYVDENYDIVELYDGHFSGNTKPNKNSGADTTLQTQQFLDRVNINIEQRGKRMIKQLCENEQINGTHYEFYSELKDLNVPEFSTDLWSRVATV